MLLLPILSVDHAFDSVSQVSHVEIDQQANSDAAEPHVREKLSLMHRMNGVNAFHFDDHQVLDDQIDPVPKLDLLSIENHGQPDLASTANPRFLTSWARQP